MRDIILAFNFGGCIQSQNLHPDFDTEIFAVFINFGGVGMSWRLGETNI
ncbi:hypothetical protein SAMN06265220_10740 [Flavobacterium nitrogenifigens]|uniref:Uncharacterized protein n=1 Tax=Flavobacterium nitrogenifigens TaxID=1617283 RepID=A0A521F806_9FLAO|nr:hypothetical protein SAMN06265220_10740 [Flavobacterium nitrogenifigens]